MRQLKPRSHSRHEPRIKRFLNKNRDKSRHLNASSSGDGPLYGRGKNKINVKKRTIGATGFNWIEAELLSSISVYPMKAFSSRKIVHDRMNTRNIAHCNTHKPESRKEKHEEKRESLSKIATRASSFMKQVSNIK